MKTDLDTHGTTANPTEAAAGSECQAGLVESVRPAILPVTPMDMLAMAVSQNADLDKLQKLMDLQERWEATGARKAYNVAFSNFKAEAVQIIKNISVTDGPLKGKKYADLFAVVTAATPALSKHGLSASWKLTKDEPAWLEVTCVLRHELGHTETVSMGGPPDAGGAKNAIQARASSVSYLERYTFTAITGLASSNGDNDGNGPSSTAVQFVMDAKDRDETIERFGVEYQLAGKTKNQRLQRELIGARDQRIEQLKKAGKP